VQNKGETNFLLRTEGGGKRAPETHNYPKTLGVPSTTWELKRQLCLCEKEANGKGPNVVGVREGDKQRSGGAAVRRPDECWGSKEGVEDQRSNCGVIGKIKGGARFL